MKDSTGVFGVRGDLVRVRGRKSGRGGREPLHNLPRKKIKLFLENFINLDSRMKATRFNLGT